MPSVGQNPRRKSVATIGFRATAAAKSHSRLYAKWNKIAHYPTDVLGGYAFGLAWGGLMYTTLEVYHRRRSARRSAVAD